MHVADLDGDGHDDLLLAGTDRFGVVLTGQKGQRLRPLASYESNRNEAKLADLAAGDLNGDGQPDIALTDIAEHFIEIVTSPTPTDLNRGSRSRCSSASPPEASVIWWNRGNSRWVTSMGTNATTSS